MVPQIKNLFIILCILCFLVGCAEVKHVVSDVKEAIAGEKKDPPKAPASSKKGTPKATPPPAGEVFGPR